MEKSRQFLTLYLVFGCIGWALSVILYFQPMKMTESLSISYLQSAAWYKSRTVIAELHHLISEKTTLSDDNYRMKLHNILSRQLVVYSNDINNVPTYIPEMGKLYQEAFRFEQYEKDINQIAIEAISNEQAITLIEDVMEYYQNEAIEKIKKETVSF